MSTKKKTATEGNNLEKQTNEALEKAAAAKIKADASLNSDADNDPIVVEVELSESEKGNAEERKGRLKSYTVKANEKHLVHAEIEQTVFKTRDGKAEKQSVPTVQIFDVRAWDNFRKFCFQQGFNHVRVLHAPSGVNLEVLKPTGENLAGKK